MLVALWMQHVSWGECLQRQLEIGLRVCPLAAVTLMTLTGCWRKEMRALHSFCCALLAHGSHWFPLLNTSNQNRSCLCGCPVHKGSPCLCKPLRGILPSPLHWRWTTRFSTFFYSLFCRCECPLGGSAKKHLNSLDFSNCALPLRWALHGVKIIMVFNANMRWKHKWSHIFRQFYLLIIPYLPSRYCFHSCAYFCCEFVFAEIDLFKFGSWRDKFADICGTHENDPGWNCCCTDSVLPSHCIPCPAARRAPSLCPREDYCLLIGNIILFGM